MKYIIFLKKQTRFVINKTTHNVVFIYQKVFSPDTGVFSFWYDTPSQTCVFYPTCSEYFKQTVHKNGLIKGFVMGVYRILRCHPWQKQHIDLP